MSVNFDVPVTVVYNSSKPYNGIFKYYQEKTGTHNIVDANFIGATGPDNRDNYPAFPLITKDEANTYYRTVSNVPLWFLIDFKKYFFILKSYTYRTYYVDFFKEWYMQGSNNGINFEDLHCETDYKLPSEKYHTENFKTKKIKPFRYFKIVPIGSTIGSNTFLAIHRLEFFGVLHSKASLKKLRMSCMNHQVQKNIIFLLLQLVIS